jgi:repressor LexA
MSEPLTQLEQQVYHYLIDFLAENTYQPSIREIARQFRIKSTKTVSDLLHSLAGKGYIQRDESRSRGVRLLGFAAARATQPIAFYDRVDSVPPPLRPENRKSFITVDRRFLPSSEVFCMRASGNSMAARGIFEGDYVMICPTTKVKDGDIVAARIGLNVVVRTITRRDATTVLESADTTEAAIEVGPHDDYAVLGIVCGVFRPFQEQAASPLMPLESAVVS